MHLRHGQIQVLPRLSFVGLSNWAMMPDKMARIDLVPYGTNILLPNPCRSWAILSLCHASQPLAHSRTFNGCAFSRSRKEKLMGSPEPRFGHLDDRQKRLDSPGLMTWQSLICPCFLLSLEDAAEKRLVVERVIVVVPAESN